jgi:transposase
MINVQKCDGDVLPFACFIWKNKPEQVAEMQAVSNPTIYGWIDRWRSDGVEGLANRPKSGRPPKADDADSLALVEAIEKEPSELGYDFTIWTNDRLRAQLEKITP